MIWKTLKLRIGAAKLKSINIREKCSNLFISLNMQIRSNIDSPRNMPEILDLLAPIAREIITPEVRGKEERENRKGGEEERKEKGKDEMQDDNEQEGKNQGRPRGRNFRKRVESESRTR